MTKSFIFGFVSLGVFLGGMPRAVGNSVTGTQTLSANIGAKAKLSVVQSSVSLLHTGATFANFTGTVTVQYKVRTTISSGSSTLVVQAASDFSPVNGPSIARSDLTYTCSGVTLGAGCSGSQTVSTISQTNVVTVGAGACSGTGCAGPDFNSGSISLILVDDPVSNTGSYSTNLMFSISAL